MATLIPNNFSSYELTAEEELIGQTLNFQQKAVLQNKLAGIVQEKLTLTLDVSAPAKFTQDEAYLRGQMDVITWLLDTALAVEEEVKRKQQESAEQ